MAEALSKNTIQSAIEHVEDFEQESVKERATYTRDFLEKNDIDEATFRNLINAVKGVPVPKDFDFKNDLALTTVVVHLQAAAGLPLDDSSKGSDGKLGSHTLNKLQKYLDKSKEHLAVAALGTLRYKVKTNQKRRKIAEGIPVQHKAAIAASVEHQIDQSVIKAAEKETKKAAGTKEMLKRKNLAKIVYGVARMADVPPAAIYAVMYFEKRSKFNDKVTRRGEAGMGQFMGGTWRTVRKKKLFRGIMKRFTDQDPTTIGRGKSIVADVAGIATFLKMASKSLSKSAVKVMANSDATAQARKRAKPAVDLAQLTYNSTLTTMQMRYLRFYYHYPTYAKGYVKSSGTKWDRGGTKQFAKTRKGKPIYTGYANKFTQIQKLLAPTS